MILAIFWSISVGIWLGSLYAIAFIKAQRQPIHCYRHYIPIPYSRIAHTIIRCLLIAGILYIVLRSCMTNRILILIGFLFSFWFIILRAQNDLHGKS